MKLNGNFPIDPHPTWEILDSSKVQQYMGCPRKYLWKYGLGFTNEGPNVNLVFGEGVHRALAVLDRGGDVEAAYKAFLHYYREYYEVEDDEYNAPKSPAYLKGALSRYQAFWKVADQHRTVMLDESGTPYIEVAGSVPISNRHELHFRIDKLAVEGDKVILIERKTTKYLSEAWLRQWDTKFQVHVYLLACWSEFGRENVRGAEIDGIIAQKGYKKDQENPGSAFKFERVPVRKTPELMREWLALANYWLDKIEHDFGLLCEDSEDKSMSSFRMNTEHCVAYNRPCAFLPYCSKGVNPLSLAGKPQPGFKIEFWDPRSHQESAKKLIKGKEIE